MKIIRFSVIRNEITISLVLDLLKSNLQSTSKMKNQHANGTSSHSAFQSVRLEICCPAVIVIGIHLIWLGFAQVRSSRNSFGWGHLWKEGESAKLLSIFWLIAQRSQVFELMKVPLEIINVNLFPVELQSKNEGVVSNKSAISDWA